MKRIFFGLLGICFFAPSVFAGETDKVPFDFSEPSAFEGWKVEDDGIMGGRSKGNFFRDPGGHAVFSGTVSLENNGGFSSVQKFFEPIDVSAFRVVVIRIKGDGREYRFIVESERNARHYYAADFATRGDWQEVEIPLASLYPVRRGDRLNLANFPGRTMAQVRFMIANSRAEDFRLEIAEIRLK